MILNTFSIEQKVSIEIQYYKIVFTYHKFKFPTFWICFNKTKFCLNNLWKNNQKRTQWCRFSFVFQHSVKCYETKVTLTYYFAYICRQLLAVFLRSCGGRIFKVKFDELWVSFDNKTKYTVKSMTITNA